MTYEELEKRQEGIVPQIKIKNGWDAARVSFRYARFVITDHTNLSPLQLRNPIFSIPLPFISSDFGFLKEDNGWRFFKW